MNDQRLQNQTSATKVANFVLMYSDHRDGIYPIVARLKKEGCQVGSTQSVEAAAFICRQQPPNMIIVRLGSRIRDIVRQLHGLANKGIDFVRIPSLLMVSNSEMQYQASLLKVGFDDVIPCDCKTDVLMLKIKKIRSLYSADPILPNRFSREESKSRGNLSDMNLIDLLQALGPSRRTARITVIPEGAKSDSEHLSIFLNQGAIVFAALGDLSGETAVYRAIGWEKGNWTIEPVAEDDLPQPNNELPNEAILMEGCRLLDEDSRNTDSDSSLPE